MNKSEIEAEFDKQVIRVQSAKADTLKQEDLKEQMEDFLKVRMPFVWEISLLCVNCSVLICFLSGLHLGG